MDAEGDSELSVYGTPECMTPHKLTMEDAGSIQINCADSQENIFSNNICRHNTENVVNASDQEVTDPLCDANFESSNSILIPTGGLHQISWVQAKPKPEVRYVMASAANTQRIQMPEACCPQTHLVDSSSQCYGNASMYPIYQMQPSMSAVHQSLFPQPVYSPSYELQPMLVANNPVQSKPNAMENIFTGNPLNPSLSMEKNDNPFAYYPAVTTDQDSYRDNSNLQSYDSPPFRRSTRRQRRRSASWSPKSETSQPLTYTSDDILMYESMKQAKEDAAVISSMAMAGCSEAEMVSIAHNGRPCFKNIYELCVRTKNELQRPDSTVANINSQGMPWAMKDFIFAFVRMTNSWLIMKAYLDVPNEKLAHIEKCFSPGIRDCFSKWQAQSKELMEHLISTFNNLDVESHKQRNMYRYTKELKLKITTELSKEDETSFDISSGHSKSDIMPTLNIPDDDSILDKLDKNWSDDSNKNYGQDEDKFEEITTIPQTPSVTSVNPLPNKSFFAQNQSNSWRGNNYKHKYSQSNNCNIYNSWRTPRYQFSDHEEEYKPRAYTKAQHNRIYIKRGSYEYPRKMNLKAEDKASTKQNFIKNKPPRFQSTAYKASLDTEKLDVKLETAPTSTVPFFPQTETGDLETSQMSEEEIIEKWKIAQEKTKSVFAKMKKVKSPEKEFTSGESYEEDDSRPMTTSKVPGAFYTANHKKSKLKGGKFHGLRTASVLLGFPRM